MNKNRCQFPNCNKKLQLSEIELKCKCSSVFCIKHKFFLDHNCTFNYKKEVPQEYKIRDKFLEQRDNGSNNSC